MKANSFYWSLKVCNSPVSMGNFSQYWIRSNTKYSCCQVFHIDKICYLLNLSSSMQSYCKFLNYTILMTKTPNLNMQRQILNRIQCPVWMKYLCWLSCLNYQIKWRVGGHTNHQWDKLLKKELGWKIQH